MKPEGARQCQAQQVTEKTLDHKLNVRGTNVREGRGLICFL